MDKKKLFASVAVSILVLTGAGIILSRTTGQTSPTAPSHAARYPIPPSNVAVANGPNKEAETTVAISPVDPETIVAGAIDWNTPGGTFWCGYYTSHDRGKTWKHNLLGGYPGGPRNALTGYYKAADPVIAADSTGNFYYAGLAVDQIVGPLNINAYDLHECMFVAKSTDKGDTFDQIAIVCRAQIGAFKLHDKEWIAVDPANGNIYLSWVLYNVHGYVDRLMFSRSTDGGKSWSTPAVVLETQSGELENQGTAIAVGNDGNIHISWIDFNHNMVRYACSKDKGNSFSKPVDVASLVPLPGTLPNGHFRTWSYSSIAVDTGYSNASGSIYITWADYGTGDADILLSSSHDGGASWNEPVRVNNDTEGNGRDQFFSGVTVSAEGWVHVGFYDRRSDPNNTLLEYWWAISFDGGQTFPVNIPMSNVSFDGEGSNMTGWSFIGDYTSIAADNETVVAVWADARNATPAAGQCDVYGAVVPYKELLKTNKFANVTIPWPEEKGG